MITFVVLGVVYVILVLVIPFTVYCAQNCARKTTQSSQTDFAHPTVVIQPNRDFCTALEL